MGKVLPILQHVGCWIILSLGLSSLVMMGLRIFPISLNLLVLYTGARLGLSEHPDENQDVYGFHLTMQDNREIEGILQRSNSRTIITSIGDCGAEYR